jgi:hypothetical protein
MSTLIGPVQTSDFREASNRESNFLEGGPPSVVADALALGAPRRTQPGALEPSIVGPSRWILESAVIYGSVARGDEKAGSDLDVDLEYAPNLTAPEMAESYTNAHASFDDLSDDIKRAIGHRLRLSNYKKDLPDECARHWIECGTEIGSLGKARMVSTSRKP